MWKEGREVRVKKIEYYYYYYYFFYFLVRIIKDYFTFHFSLFTFYFSYISIYSYIHVTYLLTIIYFLTHLILTDVKKNIFYLSSLYVSISPIIHT